MCFCTYYLNLRRKIVLLEKKTIEKVEWNSYKVLYYAFVTFANRRRSIEGYPLFSDSFRD